MEGGRQVASDQVGRLWISTVRLGASFETRVFGVGGDWSGYVQVYPTLERAETGHQELVARIRESEYGRRSV
jgi:hypothetical protein